jgi:Flp pilus assembly protein CpaB
MNRRRIGFVLIGAGVIISLAVGLLVFLQANEAEALRQASPKRWVAVASADIPERSTIGSDQIKIIQIPDDAVPPGSASYLPESGTSDEVIENQKRALLGQISNQFTTSRIYRGEVFNKEKLGREALKNNPSFELAPGKVAYAFPMRINGGNPANDRMLIPFLNAVRPGDFIDVYYSSIEIPLGLSQQEEEKLRNNESSAKYLYTRRVMQNIKVMNIGFFPDPTGKAAETPRDERFLTLQVSPDEALTLKWLKDVASLTGNLEFVLRSPVDTSDFPQTTVTFDMMATRYGIGTGR